MCFCEQIHNQIKVIAWIISNSVSIARLSHIINNVLTRFFLLNSVYLFGNKPNIYYMQLD